MQLQRLARYGSSYSRWRLTERLGLLVLGLVVARPIEALHKVAAAPAIVLVVIRARSLSGIRRGMEQHIE